MLQNCAQIFVVGYTVSTELPFSAPGSLVLAADSLIVCISAFMTTDVLRTSRLFEDSKLCESLRLPELRAKVVVGHTGSTEVLAQYARQSRACG